MASRSRKSRSSSGGSGGGVNKVVWALVVAGLIFAFFQIPYDPGVKGIWGVVEAKAKTVENWAKNAGPNIEEWISSIIQGGSAQNPPSPTGVTYEPYKPLNGGSVEETNGKLSGIQVSPAQQVAYNRDEWNHWVDVRSCWTVREQVLARDAVAGSLNMKDGNGNPTTDVNAACEIISGKWVDSYTGTEFTNPKDLDIDHMIPLKYAATHGGQAWDKGRKQSYANSLEPGHLIAVSASANRSKSDKGPADWSPSNEAYKCNYASSWISVSNTWGLSVTEADKNALQKMLETCK